MSKLTDEQINQMWSDAHNDTSTTSLIHVLARAIESVVTEPLLQRIAELERQLVEARNQALEDAAVCCDVTPPYPFRPSIEAAHAIRAMKKEQPNG